MNEKQYPFSFENQKSSNLYQALSQQMMNMMGIETYYIPVELRDDLEDILGELKQRVYKKVYGMRLYLEDMSLLSGSGDVFSKFGLQVNDEIVVWISRAEFLERTTGIPKADILKILRGESLPYDNTYRDKLRDPKIGDLIWTPMWNSLFEVSYAESQDQIVLGYRGFWKMTCKKYNPAASEIIQIPQNATGEQNTGMQEIIDVINNVDDNAKAVKDIFNDKIENEERPRLLPTGEGEDIFGSW